MRARLYIGLLVIVTLSALPAGTVAGEKAGFTTTPKWDAIPAGPITGEANGRPFEAKAVFFEPSFGKWTLVIADLPLPDPLGLIFEGQTIKIDFDAAPKTGARFEHPLKYGGGYFHIQKSDDPKDLTSWNGDNVYLVEITKWDVKPYQDGTDFSQLAGRASGRIYIAYKAAGDLKDSWAAGTFTDAPVRYRGDPALKY